MLLHRFAIRTLSQMAKLRSKSGEKKSTYLNAGQMLTCFKANGIPFFMQVASITNPHERG